MKTGWMKMVGMVCAAGIVMAVAGFAAESDPATERARQAALAKQNENETAVFQDQLRRTATRGTITGRFKINQPADNHFRASIEVLARNGRMQVGKIAFGEAGGWTYTANTAEFKVENVPIRDGVNYFLVVNANTCPKKHVFIPTPKSDIHGYWEPQDCTDRPLVVLLGKGVSAYEVPVQFNKQNTADVGEIVLDKPIPLSKADWK